jgi:hypothetical protein
VGGSENHEGFCGGVVANQRCDTGLEAVEMLSRLSVSVNRGGFMKKIGFALLGLALAATLSIAADARSSAGPMTAMY